ncbi:MAG: uncharacterized protein QOG03_2195 [Actinomycetota bacterium]|jgi:uncharacterized protein (TIGR01777 family)|nr:uncharacterized protein [Actinomycetota bacterium]
MKILISGSHGLIGSALIDRLHADGHSTARLVRGQADVGDVSWDPAGGTLAPAAVEGFDGVVHLAGEGIGEKRWTAEQKAKILDSRVQGTTLLASTLAQLPESGRPSVLVSASAVGYYGDRGSETLTEDSSSGAGFLAEVTRQWEASTAAASAAGIRVVHLRTGIVLSSKGGALKETLPIFKLGLGGRLGSGRQYWSWIGIDDEVGAIVHALTNDEVRGPLNATAPNPVTNAEFTKAVGKALNRPAFLMVPKAALAVRFGSEMVGEMLVGGQKVLPARLEATGYKFQHPTLAGALAATLPRR